MSRHRQIARLALGLAARLLVLLTVSFLVYQIGFRGSHDSYHVLYRYATYLFDLVTMQTTAPGVNIRVGFYVGPAILRSAAVFLPAVAAALIVAMRLARGAAVHGRRRLAAAMDRLGSVAYAIPVFFLAMLLFIFAIKTGVFPIGMTASAGYGDMGLVGRMLDLLHHLALPWLAMFLFPALSLVQTAQARALDLQSADFVVALRSRGFDQSHVYTAHIRRPVVVETLRQLAADLPLFVTYLVIVEMVFQYTGLGFYLVKPYSSFYWLNQDLEFAVSQASLVYIGGFTVLLQFVIRSALVAFSPRLREAPNTSPGAALFPLTLFAAVLIGPLLATVSGNTGQRTTNIATAGVAGATLIALLVVMLRRRRKPVAAEPELAGTGPAGSESVEGAHSNRRRAWERVMTAPLKTARDISPWRIALAALLAAVVILPWVAGRPTQPSRVLLIRPDVSANPELIWYYFRVALFAGRGLAPLCIAGLAGVALGMAMGVAAGLRQRKVVDSVFTTGGIFPAVLVLVITIGVVMNRADAVVISMAFVAAVRFYPHARDEAALLRGTLFVDYARTLGERDLVVSARHLVPNILRGQLPRIGLLLADLVVLKANLSFLGLTAVRWSHTNVTVPPEDGGILPILREAAILDWGVLLTEARSDFIQGLYFPSVWPALMTIGTVILIRVVSRRRGSW